MLNVRRLWVVGDSLISAAKVCDCVSSALCWQAQLRYVVEWLSCCTKIFLACSRLRDSRVRWIEKARIWKRKKLTKKAGGSFFPPRPAPLFAYLSRLPHCLRAWNRIKYSVPAVKTFVGVSLADCALENKFSTQALFLFRSVCCLFHAKSCHLSDREKSSCVANSLSCHVSLNQTLFGYTSLNLKNLNWNDTGLKLHLVRLLNKSSICVINLKFKFGLLGMLLGTINLLPGVRRRLSIGLWMIFYCFKLPSSRMSWYLLTRSSKIQVYLQF